MYNRTHMWGISKRGKLLWNVWSMGDRTGMHKMEPKNSRGLLQLWNCSGVTTRVLQIANKRWTYQVLLVSLFFLFPLPVKIHNHIIHNFLKAKHKILVFSTFLQDNYKLMHIHILPCKGFFHRLECIESSFSGKIANQETEMLFFFETIAVNCSNPITAKAKRKKKR